MPWSHPSARAELKTLLHLMLPILITQMAQAAYGLVDTIMAGRVSPADLAAVAIGAGLWLPAFLFISGVMMATTPLVAQAVGAGERDQAAIITRQSLWTAFGLGLIGMLLLRSTVWLFEPLGIPQHLQDKTALYITGVSFGLPAVGLYTALRGYSEALGHPRPITVFSIIGLLLNIPLNYAFIYGFGVIPAMGGAGCGFATAITIWLMVGALLVYVTHARAFRGIRLFHRLDRPDPVLIKRILLLGLPIGVAIFFETSLFSLAALVLSPLGETVVAAHQIALSVTSQLFMIPLSLAMALTIRIGQLYGEQNWELLRVVRRLGLWTGTALACCSMLLIFFTRDVMAAAYTSDIQVQQLAVHLLIFALAYQIFDSWQVTSAGILRGLQDTAIPMWLTLFCYWLIALPLGIVLSRVAGFGAQGFWFGLVVGLGLAALLLLWRLKVRQQQLYAVEQKR